MNQYTRALAMITILGSSLLGGTAEAADKYKASFSILARQKVASVKVKVGLGYTVSIAKKFTAPEGYHLELLRVKADITWPKDSTCSVYNSVELLCPGEEEPIECAGCAYRNTFGIFEEDNSFQIVVYDPYKKGVTQGGVTKDMIFFVPDNAKSLTLKITESSTEKEHVLKVPGEYAGSVAFTGLGVNVTTLGGEYKTTLTAEEKVSYSPSVEAKVDWSLTDGKFLLVKGKVQPDEKLPRTIDKMTLTPEQFSLRLPDGSLIQSVGVYDGDSFEDRNYTHSIGRNEDGTWPIMGMDDTTTFVFVVSKELEKFQLVFNPR